MANKALVNGIDLYMKRNYEAAIKEFKRALGLAPASQNSVKVSDYMAQAYLQLNETEKAIDTYKTSIRMNPTRDDIHIKLGNLYFANKRYQEAEGEYKAAVRIYPDAINRYYLGQVYLNTGRYTEAELQFAGVKRLSPKKPDGSYGLGLTYGKMGRYEEAISKLKEAVMLKPDFYDAYAEMGYTYADSGQMDKAQEMVDYLDERSPDLADLVSRYMYKVDPPKIMFAWGSGTFPYTRSINTTVSSLDDDLTDANTSKVFTIDFQFDKQMDRASVENILNWRISRAIGRGAGQSYNLSMPIPSTEVKLAPVPVSILYHSDMMVATVKFSIRQNSSADGTVDPSHIEFKFTGKDFYGLEMDPDKDQFTGFSGVA